MFRVAFVPTDRVTVVAFATMYWRQKPRTVACCHVRGLRTSEEQRKISDRCLSVVTHPRYGTFTADRATLRDRCHLATEGRSQTNRRVGQMDKVESGRARMSRHRHRTVPPPLNLCKTLLKYVSKNTRAPLPVARYFLRWPNMYGRHRSPLASPKELQAVPSFQEKRTAFGGKTSERHWHREIGSLLRSLQRTRDVATYRL